MSRSVPRILLTGAPGSGKTSLVCGLAEILRTELGVPVAGFVTQEVRERGERSGFAVQAFGGAPQLMAHVSWSTGPRVGRYRVDVAAFERVALPAVRQATAEWVSWYNEDRLQSACGNIPPAEYGTVQSA
jgi:nucleoside-triphosphatase